MQEISFIICIKCRLYHIDIDNYVEAIPITKYIKYLQAISNNNFIKYKLHKIQNISNTAISYSVNIDNVITDKKHATK